MNQYVLKFTGFFTVDAPDEDTARELVEDMSFGFTDLVSTVDNGCELSELNITEVKEI